MRSKYDKKTVTSKILFTKCNTKPNAYMPFLIFAKFFYYVTESAWTSVCALSRGPWLYYWILQSAGELLNPLWARTVRETIGADQEFCKSLRQDGRLHI